MKILVVEDEFIVRLDITQQFEDEGFDVTSMGTADEALSILPDAFDILFTDVNMPGNLDGLQLAHLVREQWPDVSVIVTSGRKVENSRLPEACQFIPKPYRIESVLAAIQNM